MLHFHAWSPSPARLAPPQTVGRHRYLVVHPLSRDAFCEKDFQQRLVRHIALVGQRLEFNEETRG
jgi:hypothetical protein